LEEGQRKRTRLKRGRQKSEKATRKGWQVFHEIRVNPRRDRQNKRVLRSKLDFAWGAILLVQSRICLARA